MIICFDGVDKKTYEAYRKGGDLEVLFNNMKILSEARKAANLSSPFIDVQFIVFDYNIDQIDKARELVKPFGFDRFTLKMDAEQKEPYNPDIFKSNIPCYWLYLVSTIGWDGSVTPCCDMPPTNFGNLNNHTFKEIWNGEQYVKARRLYKYDNPTKSKSMCAFCHRGPNEQYKQEIMKGGYKGNQRLLFLQKEKPWDASKD